MNAVNEINVVEYDIVLTERELIFLITAEFSRYAEDVFRIIRTMEVTPIPPNSDLDHARKVQAFQDSSRKLRNPEYQAIQRAGGKKKYLDHKNNQGVDSK